METVLHGFVGRCCLAYLDDVIVLGKSVEDHLANLQALWSHLRKAGLCWQPSKGTLFKGKLTTLAL